MCTYSIHSALCMEKLENSSSLRTKVWDTVRADNSERPRILVGGRGSSPMNIGIAAKSRIH